jgi:hypothetical protein
MPNVRSVRFTHLKDKTTASTKPAAKFASHRNKATYFSAKAVNDFFGRSQLRGATRNGNVDFERKSTQVL